MNTDFSRCPSTSTLKHDGEEARVLSKGLLTAEEVPHKREMQLRLPEGTTYRSGDYLNILAVNNPVQVKRVIRKFTLPEDAVIEVTPLRELMTSLPTRRTLAVTELLSAYVELGEPVTTRVCATFCLLACYADRTKSKQLSAQFPNFAPICQTYSTPMLGSSQMGSTDIPLLLL